jgi:outer membrane lipase/esterase
LADKMYDAVKTQALDKGANKVVVLNMPGITNTPRFQATLDLVAAASGGGTAGATVRGQTEAVIKSWVEAFNKQLATKFAGNSNVVLVDFYTNFNDQIANPAQYGLTNVKTPACPSQGISPTDGLALYDAATCTSTSLSAQTPPAGATGGANWWKTYGFSDGFHPSMYGYQLLGQLVAKNLATAGWLK